MIVQARSKTGFLAGRAEKGRTSLRITEKTNVIRVPFKFCCFRRQHLEIGYGKNECGKDR